MISVKTKVRKDTVMNVKLPSTYVHSDQSVTEQQNILQGILVEEEQKSQRRKNKEHIFRERHVFAESDEWL